MTFCAFVCYSKRHHIVWKCLWKTCRTTQLVDGLSFVDQMDNNVVVLAVFYVDDDGDLLFEAFLMTVRRNMMMIMVIMYYFFTVRLLL